MKIALIEDEPECFETYEVLLRDHKHIVRTYIEADDVIRDIAEIAKYDLILLDLMIQLGTVIKPEEASETGIAIYRRLRALSKEQRIVVVTARLKSDIWNNFEADPKVRFLAKPVNDIELFYSTIENWS